MSEVLKHVCCVSVHCHFFASVTTTADEKHEISLSVHFIVLSFCCHSYFCFNELISIYYQTKQNKIRNQKTLSIMGVLSYVCNLHALSSLAMGLAFLKFPEATAARVLSAPPAMTPGVEWLYTVIGTLCLGLAYMESSACGENGSRGCRRVIAHGFMVTLMVNMYVLVSSGFAGRVHGQLDLCLHGAWLALYILGLYIYPEPKEDAGSGGNGSGSGSGSGSGGGKKQE
jgi:uncharacterized membrane protein YgcG